MPTTLKNKISITLPSLVADELPLNLMVSDAEVLITFLLNSTEHEIYHAHNVKMQHKHDKNNI